MSIFYIKTKSGDVFELTATTDVSFNHRNTNTKFPVESGASITDHSVIENSTFSLSGVITEVVNLTKDSPQKGIKAYIEGLDALRKSKVPFTVFLDNRLKPYTNCLFTEFSGTKGVAEGVGAWRINIGIEQVKFVDKARASLVEIAAQPDPTSSASDGSDATKDGTGNKKDEGNKPQVEFAIGTETFSDTVKLVKESLGGVSPPDATTKAG
jgi:hypothetical protein